MLLGMCRWFVVALAGSQSVLCHRRGVRGRVISVNIWVARRDISFFHVAIPAGLLSMGMRSSASVLGLGFAVAMSLSWIIYGERVLNVDFGFSTRVCEHDSSADDTIRVMSR
jgi:hypothetical protein